MLLIDKISEAVNHIQQMTDFSPQIGIILGTGLSGFADELDVVCRIPYSSIPHFAQPTVESHRGELILGTVCGKNLAVMAGRFHYYEGYSMEQITFPIRVLKALGIKSLWVSNAAGGLNADFQAGDIVFIRDHINLFPENPLRGKNDERLGVRFPDMSQVYNQKLIQTALEIGRNAGFRVNMGVYAGWQGPSLETPAEYKFLHIIGADMVGLSSIPEVIVAKHSGLDIFGVSCITNQSYPIECIKETSLEEVIRVANQTEHRLAFILKELLKLFLL